MVTTITRGIATRRTCSANPITREPGDSNGQATDEETHHTDDLVKPVSRQLQRSELDQVSGGKVTMTDFNFRKAIRQGVSAVSAIARNRT
jgi:hypothetical protein